MTRILVLSRNYPNNVMRKLGLWVECLVRHSRSLCEPQVIAPVPYCPPLPGFGRYAHFRDILPFERIDDIEVWHPRFLAGPGYSLHNFEANAYYWGVRRLAERIRRSLPFDLIHAHFSYPDGVVAARLGRLYRVPVVITEHVPWHPWMEKYPRVRRQAILASENCVFHIAVSRRVRDTIAGFTGPSEKLRVVPLGVDDSVFCSRPDSAPFEADQILYVGRMQYVKGVDILFQAIRQLVDRRPKLRLVLVGGGDLYQAYRRQEAQLHRLVEELGIRQHIDFAGPKAPCEVAEYMRRSSLLVLPSRSESFGAVLIEALACGTPVVATRSGGPEDIVAEDVGVLVPPKDAEALARGIETVLDRRRSYDLVRLRAYAVENFSRDRISRLYADLYRESLDRFDRRKGLSPP